MSVLVIGGDKIDSITSVLHGFSFHKITHWDARNPSVVKRDSSRCDIGHHVDQCLKSRCNE